MARLRKAIGWICLIVICLLTVTAAATDHFSLFLPAVWVLFVPQLPVVIGRPLGKPASERLASLRSLVPPRAPPVSRSFA